MLLDRLAAQLLAGPPATSPAGVAGRLLAVQAQDLAGARLAVRARTSGLTAADVDRALTEERSLVVSWLNRGTLHLVRSEDHPWLQALTAPTQVTANDRRLGQEGVSPDAADRAVAAAVRALAGEGPLIRDRLGARIAAAGVPIEGQALYHVLLRACLRGLVVRGPVIGREQAFVLARDWLGAPAPVDRDLALAELARRYLAGHGPARPGDLARWAGLALRDARAGLAAVASVLVEREDGLLDLAGRARPAAPPPRLLGPFDPLLLGWASRAFVVGEHTGIVTSNGIFRPVVLVEGRAAGLWRLEGGAVSLRPFAPLAPADAAALEAEAADVLRFLGRG